MSASYGAPVEVMSINPDGGQQTELADTSATNLLAELPVLQAQANGANLGLQLADGTQLTFASTAGLATWLYALTVQQGQATSFVTDNYNLDMQWLGTVDQPLLDEALFWSERAQGESGMAAVEDNTQAALALRVAAEPAGNRQDESVTIHNTQTGNPTQVTVYASGDGSRIHDVAPSVLGYIESAISTVVNIAAALSQQPELYLAAAAIDGAQAGQALSQGQVLQGVLSLAQAVSAGANVAGYTQTAQIVSAAAEGVGGVYGIVQSAQTGNAAGILAGALEAAAAGAAGLNIYNGGDPQTALSQISAALAQAGTATNMASDLVSGNLGQGLVDSLYLFLPQLAQAYVNDNGNLIDLASIISDVINSSTPLQNAASETVTNSGETYTVLDAPTNATPPAQTGQSGSGAASSTYGSSIVLEVVSDTTVPASAINKSTLQAPLVMDFSAGGADMSMPITTTDAIGAAAALEASAGPTEPGLGHPIGTLEQMVTTLMGLIPLPRALGVAIDIYQAYQAAPSATSALLDQAANSLAAPDALTDAFVDRIASQLEELGGGEPYFMQTQKGASQFMFPNGAVLRFDIEPQQYLDLEPHINFQFVPGSSNQNIHIPLQP